MIRCRCGQAGCVVRCGGMVRQGARSDGCPLISNATIGSI